MTSMLHAKARKRPGAVLLHLDSLPIPDAIEIGGRRWRAKREFHVTLLGSTAFRDIASVLGPSRLFALQRTLFRASKKRFSVTLREELWWIREDGASTIIRMCDVAESESFYSRVETDLGIVIPRPPLHVTLYTCGTLRGIGIPTHDALAAIGTPFSEGETRELSRLGIV